MPGGPIIIIDPRTGQKLTFSTWGEVIAYAHQQNGRPEPEGDESPVSEG